MSLPTRRLLALLAGFGLYGAMLGADLGPFDHLQLVAVGCGMVWVLRGSFGWGGTLLMQTLFSPAVYVVTTLIAGILAGRMGESLNAAAWVYLPAIPRLLAVGLVAYGVAARAGPAGPEPPLTDGAAESGRGRDRAQDPPAERAAPDDAP